MKNIITLILLLFVYSLELPAFLDSSLIALISKAQFKGNINGIISNEQHNQVTCDSINLRISENQILQNEITVLEKECLQEINHDSFICKNILLYVLKQTLDLYEVLLDTSPIKIKFKSNYLINLDNNFSFIVSAGQSYINFHQGQNEFDFNGKQVEIDITNYQKCYSEALDFYIVKDCFAQTFGEINNCLNNKIVHYRLKIPNPIPINVINRRRG